MKKKVRKLSLSKETLLILQGGIGPYIPPKLTPQFTYNDATLCIDTWYYGCGGPNPSNTDCSACPACPF